MAEDSKKDSKVFDVAKPGEAKKDIGSKPMIIGHKSLSEDPMVKEKPAKATSATEETKEEKVAPPSVSKKVITPPSEQKEGAEQNTDEPKELQDESSDVASKKDVKEDSAEEPKVDPEVEKNERNEKLEKMVESKKYFVTVHESSASHSKTFVITFILALIVGVAAVALLIDAEILDLGIELPFDLL